MQVPTFYTLVINYVKYDNSWKTLVRFSVGVVFLPFTVAWKVVILVARLYGRFLFELGLEDLRLF